MGRALSPPPSSATLAHNRMRDLEQRWINGRRYIDIVGLAAVSELAPIDEVLGGANTERARAARDRAFDVLAELTGERSAELARALGINDHRAYEERSRTGET